MTSLLAPERREPTRSYPSYSRPLVLRLLGTREFAVFALLVAVFLYATANVPFFDGPLTLYFLFRDLAPVLLIALPMTLIIVTGEIDLSVASVMAWTAAVMASLHEHDVPFGLAVVVALAAAALAGLVHGFFIARVGLPSLVVTLAGMIGWRGAARVLVEDRSVGNFPGWFDRLGQEDIVGPLPLAILVFLALMAIGWVVLARTATGRILYVIGDNADVARYSAVNVVKARFGLFLASSLTAGVAGILFAARFGTVRADLATNHELEIITIVLLGGVSIFGGSGTMGGVALAVLIVLNLRNGFGLANVGGNAQTGVIGAILIGSVLARNAIDRLSGRAHAPKPEAAGTAVASPSPTAAG